VANLTVFDIGIVPGIRIGGGEQLADGGSPELAKGISDGLVGKMNHEIPRQPCVDVRKSIAKNVKFHEFDVGIFGAVLDDEIRTMSAPI